MTQRFLDNPIISVTDGKLDAAALVGESELNDGVEGTSHNPQHAGVVGVNTVEGIGVRGTSNGEGVHGETNNPGDAFVAGVTGIAASERGIGPGVLGQSNGGGPGVVGKANKDAGVIGFHGDPRLQETTVANDGGRAGVFGASDIGAGVLGYARDASQPAIFAFGQLRAIALNKPFAGVFDGNVQINGDLFLPGADCAEYFNVIGVEEVEPGTVMVMTDAGTLEPCRRPYDKRVVGIVSGAGNLRAGIFLDKRDTDTPKVPIALIGKVNCKVDARVCSVEIGDLLTSSSTPGHAAKAVDPYQALGAIVGKALERLVEGCGLIPILIALQ